MKIVFAGTPEFASFHLELLLNSEHEIPFVLTQPDKKSGRGNKIIVVNIDRFIFWQIEFFAWKFIAFKIT